MADYMRFFCDRYEQGKGSPDRRRTELMFVAIREYCDARRVLPIARVDYEHHGDPFKCKPHYPMFCSGILWEEMDAGKSAQEAFDLAFGEECVWREMKKDEGMPAGERLALMPRAERDKAMEIFGVGPVLRAITSGRAVADLVVSDDALNSSPPGSR